MKRAKLLVFVICGVILSGNAFGEDPPPEDDTPCYFSEVPEVDCNELKALAGGNTLCSGCYTNDPPSVPTSEATFLCANRDHVLFLVQNTNYNATWFMDIRGFQPGDENVEGGVRGEWDGSNDIYVDCGEIGECEDHCSSETVNGHTTVACVLGTTTAMARDAYVLGDPCDNYYDPDDPGDGGGEGGEF